MRERAPLAAPPPCVAAARGLIAARRGVPGGLLISESGTESSGRLRLALCVGCRGRSIRWRGVCAAVPSSGMRADRARRSCATGVPSPAAGVGESSGVRG